jgi:hypothetical protein
MTVALTIYAGLCLIPIAIAARNYHDFTLDELEAELERRIAEEEDDEGAANDNAVSSN